MTSAVEGIGKSGQSIWSNRPLSGKSAALYGLACATLAVVAFAFTWATGHRGVFLLDQSIIFDGGWRILQGQTQYKDFLAPFGPVTFYIQALFFRLFGVNWTATVLPACLFNSLAALSVVRIVRLLGRGPRLLALCGGLATAICFQAPFGTLWFEQTAMFFDLMALQAVAESLRASGYRAALWQLAGGVSLALAALSKQNYGVLFIPIAFAVLAIGEFPDMRRIGRSVLLAGVGLVAAMGIVLGWVWKFSDFHSFVRCTLVLAGEIGRSRMTPKVISEALSFSIVPNLFQVDLIGVFFGVAGLFLALFNFRRTIWRQIAPACVAAMLLPLFRSVSQASTLNEFQNNFAFVGLASCLGVSLFLWILAYISVVPLAGARLLQDTPDVALTLPSARLVKVCLFVLVGVWAFVVMGYEAGAAWVRTVQEFTMRTSFRDAIHVRGMESVRWGEPTPLDFSRTATLRKADFEGVANYLAAKEASFFVMGDSTLLYGLLGVRSPQPLLYFQPSHSFLAREIPQLDEVIANSLERSHPQVVVREKLTILPENGESYQRFPRLWSWFTSNFSHITDFGNYEVWERRPEGPR